eukprot:Gb_16574 [translate_table: standard]
MSRFSSNSSITANDSQHPVQPRNPILHHNHLLQQQQQQQQQQQKGNIRQGLQTELEMAQQDAWRVCNPDIKRPFLSVEDACERSLHDDTTYGTRQGSRLILVYDGLKYEDHPVLTWQRISNLWQKEHQPQPSKECMAFISDKPVTEQLFTTLDNSDWHLSSGSEDEADSQSGF